MNNDSSFIFNNRHYAWNTCVQNNGKVVFICYKAYVFGFGNSVGDYPYNFLCTALVRNEIVSVL